MDVVIFTDLDGTLLDHETYSLRRAVPAIDLLVRRNIPVIPVSSKTSSEIRHWMKLLTLKGPFISENGCGIVIPVGTFSSKPEGAVTEGDEWRISLGRGIGEIRRELAEIERETGIRCTGIGQMTSARISAVTGLTGEELTMCRQREYDEPFLVDRTSDIALIERAAAKRGLHLTRGGRFHHLTGGCHKGSAVRILSDLYREKRPGTVTVGIGDSGNDVPMLQAVDRAYLVQRPDGLHDPAIPEKGIHRVPAVGPHGWRSVIEEIMVLG